MDGSRFDDLTRALGRKSTRRRTLAGIAGVVSGGLFARQANARTLTICHATGDSESPYESLEVSQEEFNLHARHGDYLRVECCADSDCSSLDGVCVSSACQSGYCVQLPAPSGTACEDGTCDGAFTCHSQLSTPGMLCGSDDDCRGGRVCVNHGCFHPCSTDLDCPAGCQDHARCTPLCENRAGPRYCAFIPQGSPVSYTTEGCATGTLCNAYTGVGSSTDAYQGYCSVPCL